MSKIDGRVAAMENGETNSIETASGKYVHFGSTSWGGGSGGRKSAGGLKKGSANRSGIMVATDEQPESDDATPSTSDQYYLDEEEMGEEEEEVEGLTEEDQEENTEIDSIEIVTDVNMNTAHPQQLEYFDSQGLPVEDIELMDNSMLHTVYLDNVDAHHHDAVSLQHLASSQMALLPGNVMLGDLTSEDDHHMQEGEDQLMADTASLGGSETNCSLNGETSEKGQTTQEGSTEGSAPVKAAKAKPMTVTSDGVVHVPEGWKLVKSPSPCRKRKHSNEGSPIIRMACSSRSITGSSRVLPSSRYKTVSAQGYNLIKQANKVLKTDNKSTPSTSASRASAATNPMSSPMMRMGGAPMFMPAPGMCLMPPGMMAHPMPMMGMHPMVHPVPMAPMTSPHHGAIPVTRMGNSGMHRNSNVRPASAVAAAAASQGRAALGRSEAQIKAATLQLTGQAIQKPASTLGRTPGLAAGPTMIRHPASSQPYTQNLATSLMQQNQQQKQQLLQQRQKIAQQEKLLKQQQEQFQKQQREQQAAQQRQEQILQRQEQQKKLVQQHQQQQRQQQQQMLNRQQQLMHQRQQQMPQASHMSPRMVIPGMAMGSPQQQSMAMLANSANMAKRANAVRYYQPGQAVCPPWLTGRI